MVGNSQQFDFLFTSPDEVDLSRGSLSQSLSSLQVEPGAETFYATIDRILFKKPTEIVTAVLEANGFVLNLENILSCLDQLTVGIRGRIGSRAIDGRSQSVRHYLPCLTFGMPSKARIGSLLKKFYGEIEAYEAEVERLQALTGENKTRGQKGPTKDPREENKQLKSEVANLRAQLAALASSLTATRAYQQEAERAIASGQMLPPNIRPAVVKEISAKERIVMLRSGKKNFSLPMALLPAVPNPGDPCLVYFRDSIPTSALFYEGQGRPFRKQVAQVLSCDNGAIKVRLANRAHLVITASNAAELREISSLRRGDSLIVSTFDGTVVAFERCPSRPESNRADLVQEAIAAQQIDLRLQEASIVDTPDSSQERGQAS